MITWKTADALCYFVKLPQIRARTDNSEHTAQLADTLIQELLRMRAREQHARALAQHREKAPL